MSVLGVSVGAKFAVLDLQGGVIFSGRVASENLTVSMPRAGMYVVRVNNQVKKISVR